MAEKILATDEQDTCFSSKRLFFRPLTREDKPLYFTLYSNEQVMRHIAPPFNQKQAQQLFTFTLNNTNRFGDKRLTWTVIDCQTQKKLGIVTFTWDLIQSHAASIGIMLCPNSQGKGYGLEAQGALTEYGFTFLSLNRIDAQFASTNLASEHLYHKLGFTAQKEPTGFIPPSNGLTTKYLSLKKLDWQHSFIENFPG